MNRKEMIVFVYENIINQLPPMAKYETRDTVKDAIRLISIWRHGRPADIKMLPEVIDGVLYINGDLCGRIAPKTAPAYNYSPAADYWENAILEKCGL